ncbi:MAG: LysR substrate-binding domain-containing protein [Burkholderiales bacterium]
MRLTQFTYLCAIVEHDFSISRAAASLSTSQPRISKQLQALEQELGFEVLARRRNRVLGLTPGGEAVLDVATRIAADAGQLNSIRGGLLTPNTGKLTVATTHSHARYTLLKVIKQFCEEFPDVTFSLRHSDPGEIAALVSTAKVDLGLSAKPKVAPPNVACIPAYKVKRILITPIGHPLLRKKQIDLKEIAKYPIVAYDQKFSSGWRVMEAFERAGITPRVVLTAIDAEVVKAYVAEGLGVAFLQQLTFDPARDKNLAMRNVNELFEQSEAVIMLRKNGYLRNFTYRFIQLVKPSIDRVTVRSALEN